MSGVIKNNLIMVRQGDSFNIFLQISTDGTPASLTENIVRMQVRNYQNDLMFEILGNVINEKEGKLELSITPQQSNIPVGEYKCDIQIENKDGSVNTIFPLNVCQTGVFKITPQVTIKED